MKRKYLLMSIVMVALLAIINTSTVNSKIVFPPYGSCGDPVNTTTCVQSGCHGGPIHTPTSQDLSLLIGTTSTPTTPLDSTFKYVPNTTYYITFDITQVAYAYGFQMTALDSNNNMAGSFTVVNSATTKLALGPPDYIGHLHANHTTNSWTFQWTAPAKDSGAVTFYYAFNPGDSANFTGLTAGSNIYVSKTTIQPGYGVGINSISDKISAMQVYPNPVNAAFNLAFDVKKGGEASALLYSIDGKLCKQLFNENLSTGNFNRSFDVSSFAAGIYFVKLNIDGATATQKIIIQ